MLFDHDTLRVAAAWSGEGFIDWNGINFNGRHQVHPRVVGHGPLRQPGRPRLGRTRRRAASTTRGSTGRDGKPYGPLPRAWAQYRGLYHYGDQVILSYTVGEATVLEMPAYELAPGEQGRLHADA